MFVLAPPLVPAAGFARISSVKAHDLVVFGRIKNLKYEALDEFGMNGQFTAQLTVTRVIRGRPPSPVLTISYISHSGLSEGEDFQLHVRRSTDGTWLVCSDGGGRGYICR